MNRIIYSLILLFTIGLNAWSQEDDQTLITIGNTKVSVGEFKRIYQKNNSNLYNETDKKTPAEYLDLFINFKLKVIEAETLKMDTSAAFIKELAGYREELAAPYLTDVNYEEKLVEKIYDRMTKEIDASHILFMLEKDASPAAEKQVFDKAINVRNEILAGKDFNEAAFEYSEDPSAKTNRGNLGYFTAFQMVAPFEDAAYSTPVGDVSQPVRTSFGYHLITVNDIRPNQGEIQVAHIMKMFPQGGASEVAKAKLKAEIDSIYAQVKAGADFAELAKKYSDDKKSGSIGGELPWFSSGRMIPEFSGPAFNLRNIGDITPPIETPFGYHIIKKLGQKLTPPLDEVRQDIETRIKRDPQRSTTSKKAFIDKLKNEYNYTEKSENVAQLKGLKINTPTKNPERVLFSLNNMDYTFDELNCFLTENKIQNSTYGEYYDVWVDEEITKFENSQLEEKYPEFKNLLQEYHDGILLFNISEEKVWNYASLDTAGLERFYKKNKRKYSWEERFKGYIVIANSKEIKERAEEYFASEMNGDEISDLMNSEGKKVTITEGAWEKGANPIVDYFVWNGPEPQYFVAEHTFIRGDIIKPQPKTLEEARGLYISDYQNYLESKWVKSLRKKYKITIDKKFLNSISGV